MFVSKAHRPLGYLLKSFVKEQPVFSHSKQAFLETFSAISKNTAGGTFEPGLYPCSSAQVLS
jgi:hypothetical protein